MNAAKTANITIEAGDVVLFHTGWMNVMESDPKRFMAGEPGLGMDGAEYLASLGVAAVGSDTWPPRRRPGSPRSPQRPKPNPHSKLNPDWNWRVAPVWTLARLGSPAWWGGGAARLRSIP